MTLSHALGTPSAAFPTARVGYVNSRLLKLYADRDLWLPLAKPGISGYIQEAGTSSYRMDGEAGAFNRGLLR